jgi:hypothetical protein
VGLPLEENGHRRQDRRDEEDDYDDDADDAHEVTLRERCLSVARKSLLFVAESVARHLWPVAFVD